MQQDPGVTPPPCPRPIIIAAAGGASRAGFMMASIIGYFLDMPEPERYGIKGLSTRDVRNRIFAISGVSGGSMGAVMLYGVRPLFGIARLSVTVPPVLYCVNVRR